MEIGTNKCKKNGRVGYTLTCGIQSKYKDKKVKSASMTVYTDKSPKEVIEKIKGLLL